MKPPALHGAGRSLPAAALALLLALSPLTGCSDRNETDSANYPGDSDTAHVREHPADTANRNVAGTSGDGRPATRTDTIMIEGMPEPVLMRLVSDGMPFSTYIPQEEIRMEQYSSGEGTGVRFIANFGGILNPDAFMSIFVPEEMSTVAEMEELMAGENGVIRSNGWQGEKATAMPGFCPWGKSGYAFKGKKDSLFIVGHACIGMHGGKPFYVLMAYPEDYEEGFVPRAEKILSELRWGDSGEGLR